MGHEIDLKNYHIRTDLVIDDLVENEGINHKIESKNGCTITYIHLDKKNSLILNKQVGDYITIEFDDITDSENKNNVKNIFKEYLKKLLEISNLNNYNSCLVVGLGNQKSTPDALGPTVVEEIIVTRHIMLLDELDSNYGVVSAIAPGVMGNTGIETVDYIKGIIEKITPDFIIIIDALASKSIQRLNKTIQMTNTGIAPGSGVGNHRKELTKKTLNIPVISIGVPTVVDAVTIVSDTINFLQKKYAFQKKFLTNPINKLVKTSTVNYLKSEVTLEETDKQKLLGFIGTLNDDEIRTLISEVLTPIGYNLMTTPKEIDFVLEKITSIISEGINETLHKIK